jgi:hypothetical protein
MALATLHMAAIPVLAGLVAGTGAVATFMSSDRPVQTAAVGAETPQSGKSCDAQTWPYIEQRCLAGKASADQRPVRLVTAPVNEPATNTTAAASNPAPAPAPSSAAPAPSAPPSGTLVTRDTVLRAPHYTNTIAAVPDTVIPERRMTRREMRREARQQRAERRMNAQAFQVPSETRYGSRPVIVVRPLRLDAFR